ncbi:putative sulfate exporter family transporter [Streptosporangium sp. NPDC051023]|uniref:YeiH family protein n=1 Tax=Streptosporangium sp. NPDC051023 TaxID=3155410 RepID=UPI00344CFA38
MTLSPPSGPRHLPSGSRHAGAAGSKTRRLHRVDSPDLTPGETTRAPGGTDAPTPWDAREEAHGKAPRRARRERAWARAARGARALAPGLALTAAAVTASLWVSRMLPGVSAAVLAVVLGVALTNLGGLRPAFGAGLRFASRRLLRLAIVMLGLQIALPEVLALGWRALALIAVSTACTFLATRWLGPRIGVSPRRSLLIATGVSICGAAAVAAMHEVADSDDDDVASAVGVVVLYGSAALVALPVLARLLGLTPHQLGVWAGASVHEVAQVAAVGAAAGAGVLASAVVVKLARVVLLAPIVALTSIALRRTAASRTAAKPAGEPGDAPAGDLTTRAGEPGTGRRPPVVPLFVLGFLATVTIRSLGVVPAGVTQMLPQVTGLSLAAALFALGTGVNLRELVRGGRSLVLGGVATTVIGAISLIGVAALG